ncbi:MAG: hypothetical protein U5J63_03920 [Fodinibius sp.]|nr:hypothetical protein [Fodinibius sp.]
MREEQGIDRGFVIGAEAGGPHNGNDRIKTDMQPFIGLHCTGRLEGGQNGNNGPDD